MFPKLLFIFLLSVILCDKSVRCLSNNFREARSSHAALELSDNALSKLADKKNLKHFNEVLSNILVPRVVGTKEHDDVADYIVNTMEAMGWAVDRLKFKDRTPTFGELEFQNIVAKLNPSAERQLVLACHYDSKYIKNNLFLGATDSAVPCAMMINLAYVMRAELDASKADDGVGLTFVFFDGEEAFDTWSDTDSIYGAKNLAHLWQKQSFRSSSGMANELDRIDLFVLLDLLGAKNPQFYSYFSNTARWFELLADNELRLSRLGKLKRHNSQYFIRYNLQANIEDDHLPFLRKGVPILHMIPTPFPDVWHKMSDNRSAVDFTTVENLNKILRAFVAQYMHLTI